MSKVKGSFCSTWKINGKNNKVALCDVASVAEILAENWGNIPRTLNDKKAMELHLLAVDYLRLRDECKTRYPSKNNGTKTEGEI